MALFRKRLRREPVITKYKIGERVPSNQKADKIAENAVRDIKHPGRKRI